MKFFRMSNILGTKSPFVFRIRGTIISKIYLKIIFGVTFSILVVCLHKYVPGMQMEFKPRLVPILGASIGLLIAFRTNTAYDRYYEGRRIWSTMTHHIRLLTRCIWLGVKENGTSKEIIEKTTALNLLIAFIYATKNYLREEYSYDADPEVSKLLRHLRNVYGRNSDDNTDIQPELLKYITGGKCCLPAGCKTKSISINTNEGKNIFKTTNGKEESVHPEGEKSGIKRQDSYKAYAAFTPTNIPLELAYFIASYIYSVQKKEMVDGLTSSTMIGSLNCLMECLSLFERILTTPIPLAYSVHLHQAVWIYILSLPLQLVHEFGWITVPAVGFAIFALLGILAVGWEIENPFGYDANDLPLDDYCEVLRREIWIIMGRKYPDPEVWTFSPENRPFVPTSFASASQLEQKHTSDLRSMLLTFGNIEAK